MAIIIQGSLKRICEVCDTVVAIDDEIHELQYKVNQLERVVDVLRSSWKTGADAVRSTARHDANAARLEKIEAMEADINDLKQSREAMVNEALRLYDDVSDDDREGAALVLMKFCGITEPWDALKPERERRERERREIMQHNLN